MAKNAMILCRPGADRDALVRDLDDLGWTVTVVDAASSAYDALRWTQVTLLVAELALAEPHVALLFEPLGPETRKVIVCNDELQADRLKLLYASGADLVLLRPITAHDLIEMRA